MGIAAVKIKLMPSSPDTDLEKIKKKVEALAKIAETKNLKITTEPIAFGLNALILFFAWDESKELDSFEEKLRKIENVNSVEIVDMRRAFG